MHTASQAINLSVRAEILHSGAFISSFVFIQTDNAELPTTAGRKSLNYRPQLSHKNTSYQLKDFSE